MGRFDLVALYATVTLSGVLGGMSPLEFGMKMGNRAYYLVCWYENLKAFPETHSKQFGKCDSATSHIPKEVLDPEGPNANYFKANPDKKETWYGERLPTVMDRLPDEYLSSCEKYLKDPKSEPPADESDAMNDKGRDYPYKAFAYCMIQTLRNKHGNTSVEAIKKEKTHALKHWMQTLLDRENEFRVRHNVEPLKLVGELNEQAQEWADTMAKECKSYHSKNKDPGRQWRGAGTGESLAASGGEDVNADAAYLAADGWYEEIKDYPFPEGYTGDGKDELFKKIGHFTQSVWKGSKYVGYGYAYNEDCGKGKFTRYVVARYSPAGNVQGQYTSNVNPPPDS